MRNNLSAAWSFFVDIIETVVLSTAIFVVVYLFLLQPHQVRGASMEPNFHDGEYILTDKITYRFSQPKRGDIIVFRAPKDRDLDYIKRIIGLPGETIRIFNGKIYISRGKGSTETILKEPYQILSTIESGTLLTDKKSLTLDNQSYFVLGDNRNQSYDSREWGPVLKKDIIGKAWIRYWPLSRLSFIHRVTYPN